MTFEVVSFGFRSLAAQGFRGSGVLAGILVLCLVVLLLRRPRSFGRLSVLGFRPENQNTT